MSADWPEVRLEDVTSKLGDGLHGTPKYDENGEYFFINGNNLNNGKVVIDEKTKRATEKEYLKHKKNLNDRTILVSINGTIGNVALYDGEKVFLGKSACYFNVNEDVDKQFIRYVITSNYFQNYIRSLATGSTIKNVSLKLMRDFTFRLPPLEVQKEISKVLEDLDNKIELNRQTNQTLEQIAQAIFKSWFVDFEPVKAKVIVKEKGGDEDTQSLAAQAIICGAMTLEQLQKLENNYRGLKEKIHPLITKRFPNEMGLDYWSPKTLQKVADLFPNALVESELGEIPEGWFVKPLSKMIELIGGGTPKRSEDDYWGGNIPWFSVKDAPNDGDVFVINTEATITELGLKESSTKLLDSGVTIISARGTVGKLALIGVPTAMNQSCYGVKGIEDVGPYLNYLNLKEAVSTLQQNTHGAVFDTITRDTFETVFLINSPSGLKKSFETLVEPLFKKIKNNLFENNSLSEFRDGLLLKLLSGELQIARRLG